MTDPDSSFLIAHPRYLWLIWAIPVLAMSFWACGRWNRKVLARHFSADLLSKLAGSVSPARRRIKLAMLLLSLFFSILALAEPKWGVSEQTVRSSGRDLFILLDVSKSMLATDVAPSRLDRVKLDIQDMVGVIRGDRIGLIVFAGHPVLKCPLTTDYAFFRKALDRIGVNSVSRGGTFIGDAIRMGIDSFTDRVPHNKVMVLISDGEDQGSFPQEAAQAAAERGIRIFTVGIGDRDVGSRIPVDGQFVQDEGKIVWTKLNPDELRTIALTTGGAYIPAGTRSVDLDRIYRQKISAVERNEMEETKKKYIESRYQLFLIAGILFLILECLVSERKKGFALACLAIAVMSGDPAFGEPFELYNEGRDLYARGAFDSAAELFSQAASGTAPDLESDAFYNLGNAHVKSAERRKDADLDGAIRSLNVAVSAYQESLDRRPDMPDARHNMELARRLLKLLEEQKKKRQQESGQKKDGQKGQGDTSASPSAADTSASQEPGQANQGGGPQDQGRNFDRRQAEQNIKDRLKEMEALKQQLFRLARQKGIDPEKAQEPPAGVIVGGGYKDW